jgi:hypothetical protein
MRRWTGKPAQKREVDVTDILGKGDFARYVPGADLTQRGAAFDADVAFGREQPRPERVNA